MVPSSEYRLQAGILMVNVQAVQPFRRFCMTASVASRGHNLASTMPISLNIQQKSIIEASLYELKTESDVQQHKSLLLASLHL